MNICNWGALSYNFHMIISNSNLDYNVNKIELCALFLSGLQCV